MKLLDSSVYLGPSIYAHFPVIRLTLDLGELEQWPSVRLGRGFIDALLEALPGLRDHGCSYGEMLKPCCGRGILRTVIVRFDRCRQVKTATTS